MHPDAKLRRLGVAWRGQRICAVMRIEVLRLWRDRPTLSLIFAVPAIQILLFGAAVNLNPTGLTLAIAPSASVETALVRQAAQNTGYFKSIIVVPSQTATQTVRDGKAKLAIEWSEQGAARLVVDASDPAAVRPAALALAGELQKTAASSFAESMGVSGAAEQLNRGAPSLVWLFNPQASTTWAITPPLVGVVVMISMLLLGALTLVREREQGYWETLLATAVDGADALVGKLAPYVLLGVIQAAIVVASAHWFFGVPVVGSLTLLLAAAALLAAAHLLLGFLLSALAQTQLQAIQAAVFFYLPSMLLSGFMFPFEGMPIWAQRIGECIPLTHFVRVARALMLRGADFGWVVLEMVPVAICAALAAFFALLVYRRHLS
jgi:ABC-2 type transport system permease protein